MPRVAAVAPLLAAALCAAPAAAIVYVLPTDGSMVERSPVIVFGEVRSVAPAFAGGLPFTDYAVEVEEVLKGFVAGGTILVRQPGGVGPDGMAGNLPADIELAAQQRQVLFPGAVALRQSAPHGGEETVSEQSHEDFQKILSLCVEQCRVAVRHRKAPRDRQHARERHADRAVLFLADLGQDLDARAWRRQHAHDLSGLQTWSGRPREDRLGRPEPPSLTFGQLVKPCGGLSRHAALSYGQMPPLTNCRGS